MATSNNDTVTAIDIIEKQDKLEKEALEALPGKFEKCTFNLGYVRQPLYACKTCQENKRNTTTTTTMSTSCQNRAITNEVAGMCYSCSIACHGDHELYELFPKRHFRCDCGVSDKFGQHPCSLSKNSTTKKDIANEENSYNHNFYGRYCRCDAIYDPNIEEETMYQCVACEDWFHERCIGQIPEDINDFESYVCRLCIKKYPFIYNIDNRFSIGISKNDQPVHKWISSQSITNNVNEDLPQHELKISNSESIHPTPPSSLSSQSLATTIATVSNHNNSNQSNVDVITDNIVTKVSTNEPTNKTNSLKRQIDEISCDNNIKNDVSVNLDKQQKISIDKCKNGNYKLEQQESMELFLKEGWREGLCRCEKCLNKYKEHGIEFLLNEENTIEPEEDEDAGKSLFEVGTEQMSRLDRTSVLEGIHAYQLLSNQLKNYFKTFQESGKVVTENDIRSFFDEKIKKE